MSRGVQYDGSRSWTSTSSTTSTSCAPWAASWTTRWVRPGEGLRLAEHPDPKQRHYLNLYKMGEGPLYPFWVPYHLVHFEVPKRHRPSGAVPRRARTALGGPVVEVCAVAKRDLEQGEVLDEYGMYMTYGEAVNAEEMSANRYLPEGSVEGCRLRRALPKDAVITYDDVELPAGRPRRSASPGAVPHFRNETWLEALSVPSYRARGKRAACRCPGLTWVRQTAPVRLPRQRRYTEQNQISMSR